MSKRITFLLTFIIVLLGSSAMAQLEDFQTWHTLSVDKKVTDDVTLLLEQEFRLVNNSSFLNGWLTVAGVQYKLNKNIRFRALYRYTYGIDLELGTEFDQRLLFDVVLRKKVDRFSLSYRGRYQIKFANYQNEVIGDTPLQYFRSKFQAKYNIKKSKITPYAAVEFYYSLNNPMGNEVDKWRTTLGASYSISKALDINLYYRYQQRRISYRMPVNFSIIGTGINYSF